MQFVCYSEWDQLPESADKLFLTGQKNSLFLSRPWFENLVETALDETQELRLACVFEDNHALAILPLKKSSSDHWYSLTHGISSFFSLLIDDANQSEILQCLVSGLKQLPLESLALSAVDDDDQVIQLLQREMETQGFECHRKFRFYNWVHRVESGTFRDYMGQRPAKLANTISRKYRKLQREQDVQIRLYQDAEVSAAMSDYHAVYQSSWKAEEQFNDIMQGLVRRFSKQGWSRLAVLYVNGLPVAAQIWFVVERKASIYRLAYDENWRHYSPGSILTRYLMEYVIDTDKVSEIDFLTGNEPYKQDWMSERRQRWTLTCIHRKPPKSRIHRILDRASNMLRRTR